MKYTQAFEIARTATRELETSGWQFRPDALRTIAIAACNAAAIARTFQSEADHAIADAMENAIYAARISINPNWDGSIA